MVELFQQRGLGVGRAVKAPVRMSRQLFIALVVPIERGKERGGISGMKHGWNTQFRGLVDNRRQPLIVHPQQRAAGIPNRSAKILPELDSAGSVLHQAFQPIHAELRKVTALNAAPIHPSDGGKTIRCCLMKPVHGLDCGLSRQHGDIHHLLHAAGIHDAEHRLRRLRIEMVMKVDDRESRLLDNRSRNLKLRARCVVAEEKIHFSFGANHIDKLFLVSSIFATHVYPLPHASSYGYLLECVS